MSEKLFTVASEKTPKNTADFSKMLYASVVKEFQAC